jgi:CheY-like chemotaxis protein
VTGGDGSRPLLLATVLVVEDNEVNLRLVRDVLEHHGYHVVAARDGEEGVALARAKRPALILMDLQMPRMDGFAATREIRSDPLISATPIVALTGFAMDADRQRALAAGCDEVICKPFKIAEVVGTVQRLAGGPGA